PVTGRANRSTQHVPGPSPTPARAATAAASGSAGAANSGAAPGSSPSHTGTVAVSPFSPPATRHARPVRNGPGSNATTEVIAPERTFNVIRDVAVTWPPAAATRVSV